MFVQQRVNGLGFGQFWMPWNDFPMPDLSELVMRWLGDWPDDEDNSVSSKQRQKPRLKNTDPRTNCTTAAQHPNHSFTVTVAATKDNIKSTSRRKNKKKKKK